MVKSGINESAMILHSIFAGHFATMTPDMPTLLSTLRMSYIRIALPCDNHGDALDFNSAKYKTLTTRVTCQQHDYRSFHS